MAQFVQANEFPAAIPRIDHVVVDVRDRMEEAAHQYQLLGFHLTGKTNHSIGTYNRLCVFGSDYIEFLSYGTSDWPDLRSFPVGLNGLVFSAQAAEALYDGLRARGVPVQAVQRFVRPVDVSEKEHREARFHVVRLEPRAVFDGRLYFCHHLTPELVWRPEWQAHPNGALALTRIAIAASNPSVIADYFDRLFGVGVVARTVSTDVPDVLRAEEVNIEIWSDDALARTLGVAMPKRTGRADHMALLSIRTSSLSQTLAAR
jgi:hypothetical protein